MMSKVWAIVFLSLLLIEPSASLAIKMDSGSSQDSSGSIPGSGGDKNDTEGMSGSGQPDPMQIGAGVVLGMLLGGGGFASSSGGKDKLSASSPSSKGNKQEGADGEEDDDADDMFHDAKRRLRSPRKRNPPRNTPRSTEFHRGPQPEPRQQSSMWPNDCFVLRETN